MNVLSEGPRGARPLVRLMVFVWFIAFVVGGCSDEGDAGADIPEPNSDGVAVIERAAEPGSLESTSATSTPRPTPMMIAFDTRTVDISDRPDLVDVDLRPGPWSPDGHSLVVWRVVGQDFDERPIGRLGIVRVADASIDSVSEEGSVAAPPRLVWEGGDVEASFEVERAAEWLRDGTLVIARSDGMLVQADGLSVADEDAVTQLRGQVREVLVAPNGRQWLAIGSDRAWLVGTNRVAREIAGTEIDGARAWSWRSDSAAVAVAVGAKYFTLDVESAAVEMVTEIQPFSPDREPPPPRWLAGGKLLVTAPALPPDGASGAVHRMVDPAQLSATDLHEALGLTMNPASPYDGSAWVSPDGRYVLYPEVVESGGVVAQRASWIYDVPGARAREHPPVGNPTWSPDGRRFAWVEAGALLVGDIEARAPFPPAEGVLADGALNPVWSPDGRWLLFRDETAALYVVRSDGLAGPERLSAFARWSPPPTWSPAGDRFAAAIGDSPDVTQLVIVQPSSQ